MKHNPLYEAPLLRMVVCLIVGIVLADGLPARYAPVMLGMLAGIVVVALLCGRFPKAQSATIAVAICLLGMVLTERQKQGLRVAWPSNGVAFEAVVFSKPVEKPKTMALDILLAGSGRKLKCYLHKDGRSRSLRIGDGLQINGVQIRENSDWRRGTFDYRRYLEVQGFTGNTFVASWKWRKARVSLRGLSRIERTRLYFLKLRERLLRRLMVDGQDSEQYAVVAAMALGDKSALTKELKEVYAVTGASHVLALSGLHLSIIYTLFSLLAVGRRWQMLSQMLIVLCIWMFVFLVGLPVSVVRAAAMLTVYALLSLGHREKMSVNTLAFTAIVILMINPLSLYDVGFQMSFLAVLAILVLTPLSERVFPRKYLMSHRLLGWGWGMVVVSCAAQIGVAPLVAYYFGRFSTYFLLTNFIVIPATTLVLWLSLVVIAIPSLANILLYIVKCLNTVLERIAALPGASIEALHPSVLQTVMIYVVIGACYLLATYILTSAEYRSGWHRPSAE